MEINQMKQKNHYHQSNHVDNMEKIFFECRIYLIWIIIL